MSGHEQVIYALRTQAWPLIVDPITVRYRHSTDVCHRVRRQRRHLHQHPLLQVSQPGSLLGEV